MNRRASGDHSVASTNHSVVSDSHHSVQSSHRQQPPQAGPRLELERIPSVSSLAQSTAESSETSSYSKSTRRAGRFSFQFCFCLQILITTAIVLLCGSFIKLYPSEVGQAKTSLMGLLREHVDKLRNKDGQKENDSRESNSLRAMMISDPKSLSERVATINPTTINVYIASLYNPAMSIFKTDTLQRFGTGRVQYNLHEGTGCNDQCNEDPPLVSEDDTPCLAITQHIFPWSVFQDGVKSSSDEDMCDYDHLKCSYATCKTMVANDQLCDHINEPYDARQYYTSDRDDVGYLPLGPRLDVWSIYQGMKSSPDFSVPLSSSRQYSFNAIFTQNAHLVRTSLARRIKAHGPTRQLPIFPAMPQGWELEANDPHWNTPQLDTNEYTQVLLDSVFTLTPAGVSSECSRLYEAVEAGSIPVMTREDIYSARHPSGHGTHPCNNALHRWHDAPILILENWNELYPTIEGLLDHPNKLDEMQRSLSVWYDDYMRGVIAKFEDFVLG